MIQKNPHIHYVQNEQKEVNRIKSKTRCRVEHAFSFVTNSMNDFYI